MQRNKAVVQLWRELQAWGASETGCFMAYNFHRTFLKLSTFTPLSLPTSKDNKLLHSLKKNPGSACRFIKCLKCEN